MNETSLPLEKENLLNGFALSKADSNIAFDSITAELYKVDLDETKKEHTPTSVSYTHLRAHETVLALV